MIFVQFQNCDWRILRRDNCERVGRASVNTNFLRRYQSYLLYSWGLQFILKKMLYNWQLMFPSGLSYCFSSRARWLTQLPMFPTRSARHDIVYQISGRALTDYSITLFPKRLHNQITSTPLLEEKRFEKYKMSWSWRSSHQLIPTTEHIHTSTKMKVDICLQKKKLLSMMHTMATFQN